MIPLADLAEMDRAGLVALWSNLLGGVVPPKMSQPMLRHFPAFEIQSRQQGGLRATLAARLVRIAAGEERKPSPSMRSGTIAAALDVPVDAISPDFLTVKQPFALRRRGVETRIVAGSAEPAPDAVLQRTLAEAHVWATSLRRGTSLIDIARATGRSEPFIRSRVALAFLSPRVQACILDSLQPVDISVASLMRDGIPLDWAAQSRVFGLD